jgi:hypothetical protein
MRAAGDGADQTGLTRSTALAVAASVGLALAFICAWWTVHDLSWPAEIDLYRDLGTANAMLDGVRGDHAYHEELRWYPPLLPAIVALISRLTGAATHVVYTRGGPLLNLLAPIFFFLVARRWVGSLAATAALFGLLFFGPQQLDAWQYATYSPWLWPFSFARGLFFATLFCHPAMARKPAERTDRTSVIRSVLTGALLGLTFLAHPAPAAILAVTFVVYAALTPRGPARAGRWFELVLLGAVSFLLTLPFVAPLWGKYHLTTLNSDPSRWVGVSLHAMIRDLARPRTLIAILGAVYVWRVRTWRIWLGSDLAIKSDPRRPTGRVFVEAGGPQRTLLIACLSATIFWFAYGLVSQILENRNLALLPQIVPTFHFYLYLQMAALLAFGVGFALLVQWFIAGVRRTMGMRLPVTTVTAAVLLALTTAGLPWHMRARDFVVFRNWSQGYEADPSVAGLYDWLRANTTPDTVVLSPPALADVAVASSGRGVVSLPMNHSNPYVSFVQRDADRQRMYDALRQGDTLGFRALAERYHVSYVAFNQDSPAPSPSRYLQPVGSFGQVQLAKVLIAEK